MARRFLFTIQLQMQLRAKQMKFEKSRPLKINRESRRRKIKRCNLSVCYFTFFVHLNEILVSQFFPRKYRKSNRKGYTNSLLLVNLSGIDCKLVNTDFIHSFPAISFGVCFRWEKKTTQFSFSLHLDRGEKSNAARKGHPINTALK